MSGFEGVRLKPSTAPEHGCGALSRAPKAATLGTAVPPGAGRALEPATRETLEKHLRWDFGRVRVHSDERAARYAEHFNASAYTVANHIVLGRGRSDFALLAHEAAHVVQQQSPADAGWREQPLRFTAPGDPSEREARSAARCQPGQLSRTEPAIARQPATPAASAQTKPPSQRVLSDVLWNAVRKEIFGLARRPPPSAHPKHKEDTAKNTALALDCVARIRVAAGLGKLPAGTDETDFYQHLRDLLTLAKADTSGNGSPATAGFREDLASEAVYPTDERAIEENLTKSLPSGQVAGRPVEVQKSVRTMRFGATRGPATVYRYRNAGESWFKRAHIHVQLFFAPKRTTGVGLQIDQKAIADMKDLVQDIEDRVSAYGRSGVTMDIEFVSSAAGATKFVVNASDWPDSGNAYGASRVMAEEILHGLGLADQYDYLGHVRNDAYGMTHRLHLLQMQLKKYVNDPRFRPDLPSITTGGTEASEFDRCQVLAMTDAELEDCFRQRSAAAP